MRLSTLLSRIPAQAVGAIPDVDVTGIAQAPEEVHQGNAFVCVRGTRHDSHEGIGKALERGASVILYENPAFAAACGESPALEVQDSRLVLAMMWFAWYQNPQDGMIITGITGTNGKTSVCWYLTQLLREAGHRCAMRSTVHCDIDGILSPVCHTTPPPCELAQFFARCREKQITHVQMEVSSHSLDQHRCAAIPFSLGIFTNLSEDHLDYHGTMEAYFRAKARLFSQCKTALLNLDDPFYHQMRQAAQDCENGCYTFSAGNRNADFTAVNTDLSRRQSHFLSTSILFPVALPTIGSFTLSNVIAAIGAALLLEVPVETTKRTVLQPPAGRMEPIKTTLGYQIYIDYAHTPDALEKALMALRESYPALPIHLLFGCGGDREQEKRPKMGKIASALADYTVITSDNCRTEDPDSIICHIMRGFDRTKAHTVIANRRDAILHILSYTAAPRVVLLAGKGHEDYEIDRNGRHPFSEKDVINQYAAAQAVSVCATEKQKTIL